MRRLTFALVALWAVLASPARADVYAIVPPFFEGTDGLQVSERITTLVYEDLKRQNEQVLLPAETAKFVPPEQRIACGNEQCAERYRAAAKATAAIVIRIYRGKVGTGPATSFQIEIQPEPGIEFKETGVLTDGASLEEEALKALREAQRRYRRGPGPWLQITGAPTGAAVFVDNVQVGTLLGDTPRVLMVAVGNHSLRVEAAGFDGVTKLVSLPTATETLPVDVRLEPEKLKSPLDDGTAEPSAAHRKRAWGNIGWVIAGAGVAAYGAALLVSGSIQAAKSGDCAEREEGVCVQRYAMNRDVRGNIGLGSALVVLGAAGIGWGGYKLRLAPEASKQHVGIVLSGSM